MTRITDFFIAYLFIKGSNKKQNKIMIIISAE
jgi:hypothetical protein